MRTCSCLCGLAPISRCSWNAPVVLRDNLQDDDFIEQHTSGFEAVTASVRDYDPQTAAEMTGVPPEAIEKAAHLFGKRDRAIAMHARGLEHQSKGVENCRR